DTFSAHLAGALGVEVWTLLPFECDWRWMRERSDSPWYPHMRLFRQRRPRDWRGVVAEAAQALRAPQLLPRRSQLLHRARYTGAYADAALDPARNLSEPGAGACLHHPHDPPGIHVPLSADGPAGLRHARAGVRAGPALRGAQVAEALYLVLPGPWGLSRGRHERDR